MWYVDGHRWKPDGYTQKLDDALDVYRTKGAEVAEGRSLVEVRSHGNPFVDSASLQWLDNTAAKRMEVQMYRAVHGTELGTQLGGYLELVPPAMDYVQGSFNIIDIDDVELVEHGEEYIHEQLTSHYGDLAAEPEWEPWLQPVMRYADSSFVIDLANGFVPGPILVEPVRQRLGFPYEWFGAPVD